MAETRAIAVGGFSNGYPQWNQLAINEQKQIHEQIKVKDFHTLTIQAAGRLTSTWFPKRMQRGLPHDPSLLRTILRCRVTHLTKNVINIEKTRTRESKLLIVGQGFVIFFSTVRTFVWQKSTCKANCASEKTIQRSTLFAFTRSACSLVSKTNF